ncbi:MAG: zinc metallopeptidase [Anaerolinea sp.]|nr:zinc metallopeptidase [Anaerolinea sp.]
MFFFDPLYLLIFVVTLVISLAAQMYIKSAYGKWSKVANSHNLTGLQVGQELLRGTDLGATYQISKGTGVQFQGVAGNLTDHYDPRTHTVGLSQGVATQPSVASMAIVAHELGHAQQYAAKSPLIAARSFLLPAVRVSPMISYGLLMIGFILNMTGAIYLGILFFGITVLFSVLTLPVEFDASRRGLKLLADAGLMTSTEDQRGARTVLRAAAATYVAATITAILQLLYYLALANRRR